MKRLFLLLACVMLQTAPAFSQYIWVDLSFKAVLNPTNGTRFYDFTETNIDASIAVMNQTLADHQRGYRMRRVDPLYDIGGPGQGGTNGPSKWFYPNPRDPYLLNPSIRNQEQMDGEARSNPVPYRWNSNAVNYYVVAGLGTVLTDTNGQSVGQPAGEGSFPSGGHQIITLGTVHFPLVILHETGHWLELYHTQGSCGLDAGVCGKPSLCPILTNGFQLGDDDIADTLPVQAGDYCFTNRDLIALANFGIPYAACSAIQSNLVDDAFFNLMAYGFDRTLDRLTALQLDKWAMYANGLRSFAVSGRTLFVDPTTDCSYQNGLLPTCGPPGLGGPFEYATNAVQAANPVGGDIVLLRPGNYNEQFTINQPVTLRATRLGPATIGKP